MKKEIIIALVLFSVFFMKNTYATQTISGCTNITTSDTYLLNSDIANSGATACLNVSVSNVLLDCQNHLVQGIASATTYGILVVKPSASYSNITVQNCNVTAWTYGINIRWSNNDTFLNNTISNTTKAIHSDTGGSNETFKNNTILSSTVGFDFFNDGNNTVIGGSVQNSASYDYSLDTIGTTINFTATNFTSSRYINFADTTSWFNYRNDSTSNIWLKTNTQGGTYIRTLNSFTNTNISWDEQRTGGTFLSNYNITGLLANTVYNIYNGTSNPSVYTLTTDSNGNLPNFILTISTISRTIEVNTLTATALSYSNNLTSNPANYDGTKSWFNATWNDTFGTALLETNYTTVLTNYTMNKEGNVSYLDFIMPSGTFTWRIIANNLNATPTLNFTIGNGTASSPSISFSPVSPIIYPTSDSATASVSSVNNQLTWTLYRDNTTSAGTGTFSITENNLWGVGSKIYCVNTTGNNNYTSSTGICSTLTINKGTLSLSILSNVTSPIAYPNPSNITGTGCSFGIGYGTDVTCTLHRGNSSFTATGNNAQDNFVLGIGYYAYNYSSTSGANWTANGGTNYTLQVVQGTALGLTFSPSTVVTSGTQTTVTGTGCPSNFLCYIYRNDILVNNPDIQTLSIGTYNYVYNTSNTSANFSSSSVSGLLYITQASPPENFTPTVFTNITTVFQPNSSSYVNGTVPINWTVTDSFGDMSYYNMTTIEIFPNSSSVVLDTQQINSATGGTTINYNLNVTNYTDALRFDVYVSFLRGGFPLYYTTYSFFPNIYNAHGIFPNVFSSFSHNIIPSLLASFANGSSGITNNSTMLLIAVVIAMLGGAFVGKGISGYGVPISLGGSAVFILILSLFAYVSLFPFSLLILLVVVMLGISLARYLL